MSSPHPSSSAQSKKKKPRPAAQPPILPPVDEDKMARLKTRLGERAIAYLQEVNLVLDDQAQQMLGDWAMSLMLGVVAAADESATKQDRNHITSGDITAGIQQACQAGDSRPTMVDYATTTNMVNKKQLPKPRKGLQGMPNDVVAKNKEIIVNAAKKEQLQKMTEERRHALECEPSTSAACLEAPSSSGGPHVIVIDIEKDHKGRITEATIQELPEPEE
uniref:TFIID_20kDa domain-containing protein n=1 Tax=Panagrellus redivivus TaxID=6233 RepID=A0A7E4W4G5_PANRE